MDDSFELNSADDYNMWEFLEPFTTMKQISMTRVAYAGENLFAFLRSHPTIIRINAPISFSKSLLLSSGFNGFAFRNLTSLVLHLNLSNFCFTWPDFYSLLTLENLTTLSIIAGRFEIPFLDDILGLGAMTWLTRLSIPSYDITNVIPISKLTNLLSLKVQISSFVPGDLRGDSLNPLSNLIRLRTLHITYFGDGYANSDTPSFEFLKSLKQLINLSILCGPPIPIVPIMTLLSETCPNLESFAYRSTIKGGRDPNVCTCGNVEWPQIPDHFAPGFGSLKILDIDTDVPHPNFAHFTSIAHSLEMVKIFPLQMRKFIDHMGRQWEPNTWTRGGKICQLCQNRRAALCDFYSDKDRFPHLEDCKIA